MRVCKNCHELIKDELEVCPFCGYIDMSSSEKKKTLGAFDASRIPTWVRILVPLAIVLAVIAVIIVKTGVFNNSGEIEENVFESVATEVTESSTDVSLVTEVGVDILNMDGHSFACYFGCDSWEQARDYCESVGGHLAVVESAEENEALYAFARYYGYDNVYIGYSDVEDEGNWQWVTGEQSDYTNWNSGEPNGFTSGEDYAVMVDGAKWNDGEYTARIENGIIAYICEWDYYVSGINNLSYDDLGDISSIVANSIVEETQIATETSITETTEAAETTQSSMLTETQAIEAFRRFLASRISDVELNYSILVYIYYEGMNGDHCSFSYGTPASSWTIFDMDLYTGLTTTVSYYTAACADISGVGEYDFNARDYLPGSQGISTTELQYYMDTDIYSFVDIMGNLNPGGETSCIGYNNSNLTVETYDSTDTTMIGYISLIGNQNQYSIYGVKPGISRADATASLIMNGVECFTSLDGEQYRYTMPGDFEVVVDIDLSTDTVSRVYIHRYSY